MIRDDDDRGPLVEPERVNARDQRAERFVQQTRRLIELRRFRSEVVTGRVDVFEVEREQRRAFGLGQAKPGQDLLDAIGRPSALSYGVQ